MSTSVLSQMITIVPLHWTLKLCCAPLSLVMLTPAPLAFPTEGKPHFDTATSFDPLPFFYRARAVCAMSRACLKSPYDASLCRIERPAKLTHVKLIKAGNQDKRHEKMKQNILCDKNSPCLLPMVLLWMVSLSHPGRLNCGMSPFTLCCQF